MRWFLGLAIYRVLLPLLFITAFPGWLVKMLRRGGFGTRLPERLAIYADPPDFDPSGATHIHAVSVGETQLALKLIRHWRNIAPEQKFVVATGTATGHALATAAALPDVRVTYAPLDFPSAVRRYLDRFEPSTLVLIEAEVWPHLTLACARRRIPIHLVNARLSPRSARRFQRLAPFVRPMFRHLASVCVQESEDIAIWQDLGVARDRVHHTGSLKFDPAGSNTPTPRPEFKEILDRARPAAPIILAASTHDGEESFLATAIHQAAPAALPVIAPRHAERRQEVAAALRHAGFHPILRSQAPFPASASTPLVLIIDTTGELRDWTAHAHAVIIGKSFLAHGGQNPCEAIQAGKPVIFGPFMENFQPLASRLVASGGALQAADASALETAIISTLDPTRAARLTRAATQVLAPHLGATERIVRLIHQPH